MSDFIQENSEIDISLLDLVVALGQEKWTLIIVTFMAAITGVVVSLLTPATYVARTTIMPSQQASSGGGLQSLGGLAGMSGLVVGMSNLSSGIKSSDDMYIALMRSQSVQSALIEQLKLKERYGSSKLEEVRLSLSKSVNIFSDKKSGLIYIDAQDKDPEFAAQLANAQVKELNVILSRLAVTEAQQRRLYYEQQILKTQAKIPQIEVEFKQAQSSAGVEVISLLSEVGSLPGQIAAKELQLQVLSRFATGQNPEIKRLVTEISVLRTQMDKYAALSMTNTETKVLLKSLKSLDESKSGFVQKATQAYTALKIQEALLDGFVKQLELAKIDEAKEGPTVQVIDEASAPEMRAKPERKKMVIAYTITGLIFAFLLATISALLKRIQSTPQGHAKWVQIKRAWGFS